MSHPVYTADAVRAAEAPLLAAGVPLMRRAAGALADRIRARREHDGEPVLVLAGSGDNGGDALFAAAALDGEITVILIGDRAHEAALTAAREAGVRIVEPDDIATSRARWIIDGVRGIGVRHAALRARAAHTVALLLPRVTAGIADVIAVDLPSGVDPDDGTIAGAVLPAVETVTFGAIKRGLTVGAGADLAGDLTLVDIGLDLDPGTAAGRTAAAVRLIDARRRESG